MTTSSHWRNGCYARRHRRSPATAQDIFKGKDINLYVGSGAGGPYDAYARLVGRHLGKHLPGNPAVVVQNMPGASGRRLMNFMTNVAPKDGTRNRHHPARRPVRPADGREASSTSAGSPGSATPTTRPTSAWRGTPRRSAASRTCARARMVVGSSGPASTDSIYPNVLNALHGMKFKVVEGYKSATETHIAMERGEVDGRCGISFDTLQCAQRRLAARQEGAHAGADRARQGAGARRRALGIRSLGKRGEAPDLGAMGGAAQDGPAVLRAARDGRRSASTFCAAPSMPRWPIRSCEPTPGG